MTLVSVTVENLFILPVFDHHHGY